MERQLVISALGEDRPGIVNDLSRLVLECGCNIADSRMAVLGGEFALILRVSGAQEAIGALQGRLPETGHALGLTIIAKPTQSRPVRAPALPYVVDVVSMDHPGIVHEVARFFSARHVNIEKLDSEAYAAPHTGTPMFAMHMTVSIPANENIARLRDAFMEFCEERNLDSALEPEKS